MKSRSPDTHNLLWKIRFENSCDHGAESLSFLFLYRVSHIKMDFMNWIWRIKICKQEFVWRRFWNMLNFSTFSVGGCWGQPMLLLWKLVDETKISKPQDFRNTFKQILACIFLSFRVYSWNKFQYKITCISKNCYKLSKPQTDS